MPVPHIASTSHDLHSFLEIHVPSGAIPVSLNSITISYYFSWFPGVSNSPVALMRDLWRSQVKASPRSNHLELEDCVRAVLVSCGHKPGGLGQWTFILLRFWRPHFHWAHVKMSAGLFPLQKSWGECIPSLSHPPAFTLACNCTTAVSAL